MPKTERTLLDFLFLLGFPWRLPLVTVLGLIRETNYMSAISKMQTEARVGVAVEGGGLSATMTSSVVVEPHTRGKSTPPPQFLAGAVSETCTILLARLTILFQIFTHLWIAQHCNPFFSWRTHSSVGLNWIGMNCAFLWWIESIDCLALIGFMFTLFFVT